MVSVRVAANKVEWRGIKKSTIWGIEVKVSNEMRERNSLTTRSVGMARALLSLSLSHSLSLSLSSFRAAFPHLFAFFFKPTLIPYLNRLRWARNFFLKNFFFGSRLFSARMFVSTFENFF
jgi:hypothetical protein